MSNDNKDSNKQEIRRCNRHVDCDDADRRARKLGRIAAEHCDDSCCEECFGS